MPARRTDLFSLLVEKDPDFAVTRPQSPSLLHISPANINLARQDLRLGRDLDVLFLRETTVREYLRQSRAKRDSECRAHSSSRRHKFAPKCECPLQRQLIAP